MNEIDNGAYECWHCKIEIKCTENSPKDNNTFCVVCGGKMMYRSPVTKDDVEILNMMQS